MYRPSWRVHLVFVLVTLGLLVNPVLNLDAQDAENGANSPESAYGGAIDDAEFLWQNGDVPFVEKPDAQVQTPDDVKETKQFAYSLYLPGMRNDEQAGVAAVTATWREIHRQNFEGIFPTAGWSVSDYNGSTVGTRPHASANVVWDDTSTKAYSGNWAAHPNDWSSYTSLTDTWMRYGPFSLVGATDARFTFFYWLDSEAYYDFFTWEYSCNGVTNWVGQSRSGAIKRWAAANTSLLSCIGSSNVYIRFSFKSDYSNPSNPAPTGVWVDAIRIMQYK